MFCPRCGYKNNDSATYCKECGTALNANNNANSYSTTDNKPPRPDNYLIWAILCTVFCCLPLGIISIIFSIEVNSKYDLGDFNGAIVASVKAKKWATWGALLCFILVVLNLIIIGICSLSALFDAIQSL